MRKPAGLVIALITTAACAGEVDTPAEPELLTVPAFASVAPDGQFHTHAQGGEEVPAVDTDAQGQANFWLSKDGTELMYRLNVANIEDVLQSHIHMAATGSTGPIVVWLYPPAPPAQLIPGRTQGTLAAGVITASNLMGPLAGLSLTDLVDVLRAGNAYVNVHTLANPPGEIRGQIR